MEHGTLEDVCLLKLGIFQPAMLVYWRVTVCFFVAHNVHSKDSYHLGTPGELDPLLSESTGQPENHRSQDEEQGP